MVSSTNQAKGIHVLFIEDDKKHQNNLTVLIQKVDSSITFTQINNLQELFDEIDELLFDCVLIDNKVGNQDGIEIATKLHEKRDVPLIMLTSHGSEQEAIHAFNHGFSDYILREIRPGSIPILIQRIKNSVEKHRVEKQAEITEQLINSYFDEANENFILLDKNLNYITVNKHYAQANDLSREQIIGKNLLDIAPGVAESDRPLIYRRVLATGEPINLESVVIELSDGPVYVNIKAFKVGDALGLITQDVTEQRLMENRLHRERQRAQNYLNIMGAIIVTLDKDQKIKLINEFGANILGYTPKELLDVDFVEAFIPEKDRLTVRAEYNDVLNGGTNYRTVERKVVISDKTEHVFLWYNINITNHNGEIIGTLSSAVDITEQNETRKALERELEITDALSKLYSPLMNPTTKIEDITDILIEQAKLLTKSPLGYVALIEYGTGDQINYLMRQSLDGFTMDIPHNQIRLPRNPDGTYGSLWGHSLNTKESFYTNDPANHPASRGVPSGHMKISRFLSAPAILGDEIVGQIAVGNSPEDYTENDISILSRLANMFALAIQRRNYEEQYRSVVENSLNGIVIEISSKMVYVNPKYAEIFGYTQYELLEHTFESIIHPDDLKRLKKQADNRQKGLPEPTVYEFKGITKNGEIIELEALSTLINYRGKPASLSFIRDITETNRVIRELESERVKLQQAEEMDELKNKFVSTATHELRTPVTAIKGYIELLNEGVFGEVPENIKEVISVVDRNTTRLSKLTDDLLDLQRLESGRLEVNLKPRLIREIIDEVIEEMQPHFTTKKQEITTTYSDRKLIVNIDGTRMSQVLYNLLSNASKFSPENSNIRIDVTQKDNHLFFKICDQGIGITEQDLGKIFTPFPNIQKKEHISGTGLGLNITKSIIDLHDGTIWVESDGENMGTCFCFTLPLFHG